MLYMVVLAFQLVDEVLKVGPFAWPHLKLDLKLDLDIFKTRFIIILN